MSPEGRSDREDAWDVVVVGAGPAGLSAALVLGRACRRVLICDSGEPRNAASRGVHGFVTRDGTSPHELRRLGRAELARYPTVTLRDVAVVDARRTGEGGFELALAGGEWVRARKLLLATGVVDELPAIEGFAELWGRGVLPCPYCDGWEVRGQRLAVYGRGTRALELARALTGWSDDVILLSDGACALSPAERDALERRRIAVVEAPIERLVPTPDGSGLASIELEGAAPLPRDVLFLSFPAHQRSPLVTKLGCTLDVGGAAATGPLESTNVPGLFVAGDASDGPRLAIVAAAEGAMAAFAINRALVRERFEHARAAAE